jgi:hypothetical protein
LPVRQWAAQQSENATQVLERTPPHRAIERSWLPAGKRKTDAQPQVITMVGGGEWDEQIERHDELLGMLRRMRVQPSDS